MAKLTVQSFAKLPNEYVSVERSRGLSLLEEKLAYMLINLMQKRWESTKKLEHIDFKFIASGSVTFAEFREVMQISSKDNKELLIALKELFNFTLYVKNAGVTDFVHLFERMKVDENKLVINYQFHNCFIEYFTGICKDFFKLSISEVIGLNSTHAIRIYQLLKTKQNMDKNKFVFTIIELKKLLNIEKKYKLYGHLKTAILELSKEQINSSEASEFHIDYAEIKTGKAVTSIEFTILPKIQNYYVETNQIAGYRLDQLSKQVKKWLNDKELIVKHIAGKIQEELKYKKPSKAAIEAYLGTIEAIKGKIKK